MSAVTTPERQPSSPLAAFGVAGGTALAYAVVGAAALMLAGPPGTASPLYPSAGIALAAVLSRGRAALVGVWIGACAVNLGLALVRGPIGAATLVLPLLIGAGAALQAGVGAALVRRYVSQPLVLHAPRDILRFGLLGGLLACTLSPSVGTPALLAAGGLAADSWPSNWLTWWIGDTLGVLIGAPLALTLIGRPRADWQPRRRTLGVPLLLALALLAAGMLEIRRSDRERLLATFERDVDHLASAVEARLLAPAYALQALHSSARSRAVFDRATLREASRGWLSQPIQLQAMGYAERVALDALGPFEAAAGADYAGYHVFERDGGHARAVDREVVALRLIEPEPGNTAALGVNALSVPEARAAILATRDSGLPAASASFALTQAPGEGPGVVIYQALFRDDPANVAARRAQFRAVVFVTFHADRLLEGLAGAEPRYLMWCLVDPDPAARQRRLAGPAGCETAPAQAGGLYAARVLDLAGRPVELHIVARELAVPGHERETSWLLSMSALAAAALLGALLLTVTGQRRRTQLAVQVGTADLRREISERGQAEEALRESEARLRSILDHVPLGVMFLDPQGGVIECNPRLCEMMGRTAQELRGSSVAELVAPEESALLLRLRRDLNEGAPAAQLERMHLTPTHGPARVVRIVASALRDPEDRLVRMVAVLEDITEHLRLEESERALHRAEAANRAKSEFLSRMSHELRTPLNAMIGFAQLLGLDREPGLLAHQREWTQQIQRAGWHLLEMINETLDLARIESGAVQLNLVPVALGPIVAACHAMVTASAEPRGIRVAEFVAPDATAVLGDATRLKQVLTNLLSNAVKYNRDGGAVTLTTRRVSGEMVDSVEIAVADTGLGMSESQLASLFQPYNRLGREASGIEGTGIGLVISRRLSELMGGTLEVTSEAGQGSIFTLRLPAAAAAELPVVRYTDTSPAPYQRRLVHYVEDNETNIEVMRGIFAQRPQIRLETSMLGLDGLAAIRATQPDLVLLDMQLPDISGLELLRHLKQDDTIAAIPVVVVSADATTGHVEQALTSGALHYVTKPLEVAHFLETVDTILEGIDTKFGM